MNNLSNLQISIASPYAFKKTKKEFKQCLRKNINKMFQENLIQDSQIKDKYKKRLLCQIFGIQVQGVSLQCLNLKQCFKYMIKQIESGNDKCNSLRTYLQNKGRCKRQ